MIIRWCSLTLGLSVTSTVRSLAGRLAAGDQLGQHLDLAGLGVLGAGLDLAHPAVGHDRKRGVPAVIGDVDPDPLGHLDGVELFALGDRDIRCR